MYVRPYTIFSTFHPVILLLYALGAPVITMFGRNPVFQLTACICALCVNVFYMGGKSARRGLRSVFGLFLLITVMNVILNPMGITVLFTVANRKVTLESLCYGVSNGLMLAGVLLWFRSFTAVLPNQKFLYLFGKRFQKTGLLLSMIVKLFPETRYKIQCIQQAQSTSGENSSSDERKTDIRMQIKKNMRQISSLLEWSMEDGIETADSMKARGYGDHIRTSYDVYKVSSGDKIMGAVLTIFLLVSVCEISVQNRGFLYYPTIAWKVNNLWLTLGGILCQIVFFLTPVWLEIKKGKRR